MKQKKPRILIWDLETAGANSLNADLSAIVCFGYKWLGEKRAHVITIDQFANWFIPGKGLNDKPLLEAALKIMEQADILVAHFGDFFDRPFFQGRCAIHGLKPPPPTKQRDTWQIARRAFKFSNNRLQHLADIFGLSHRKRIKKVPEEWPGWWMRALAGDQKAIKEMAKYCRQDVQTLEALYLRLRNYDTAHPRLSSDRSTCRMCGSNRIQYRGFAYLQTSKYRRYQCLDCHAWGRESRSVKED